MALNIVDSPSPNCGYACDYKPEAIVWHITAGSGASALSWLRNAASNASSNYLVMEDGTTHRLVNPRNGSKGAAWANGQANKPNLSNPLVASGVRSGINPNRRTISIEHAGQTSGGKGGSLTPKQVEATIALTAQLCKDWGIMPDRVYIIPHAFIDSVDRPYCPGFSEAEWNGWIGRVAALVKGGVVVKEPIKEDIPPGFLKMGQPDTFDWQGEGVVTYRKVRYFNPYTGEWFEREWQNDAGFTPWVKVA